MASRITRRRTLGNLRELGEHAADAAKRALRNGAEIVAADAKRRAPVKTGKLRDSIKVVPASRDGTRYKVTADATKNGYTYGKVIEYANDRERAFLHPALVENRQQIRENIKNAARDAIRQGR